jgi:hypothetical protein
MGPYDLHHKEMRSFCIDRATIYYSNGNNNRIFHTTNALD